MAEIIHTPETLEAACKANAIDLYYALKAFDRRGYTQAVGDQIRRALAKVEQTNGSTPERAQEDS